MISTKTAVLVFTLLLELSFVANAVNRVGDSLYSSGREKKRKHGGRNLQQINYYREVFSGAFGNQSQTAFEYVLAKTINENATRQLEPIPFFQNVESFKPICESMCVDNGIEFMKNQKFLPLVEVEAIKYLDDFCVGPLPSQKDRDSLKKYVPENLAGLLDIDNPICDCVWKECNLDVDSIPVCLEQCSGIQQPKSLNYAKSQCNKFCKQYDGAGDPELCEDACDCIFDCSEDEGTLFQECKLECQSTYNGYVVFDFIHDRAQRLSDCVYEDRECGTVLKDWNKDGCEISCEPNQDYEANSTNYLKLRKNICEAIPRETCVEGPFCDEQFETCAKSGDGPTTNPTLASTNPQTSSTPQPNSDPKPTNANKVGTKNYSPTSNPPDPNPIPSQVANGAGAKYYSPNPSLPVPSPTPGPTPNTEPTAPNRLGDGMEITANINGDDETSIIKIQERMDSTNNMIADVLEKLQQTNEVIKRMEQTCITSATRRRLDENCSGDGLKVQCGFNHQGSIVSEDMKNLFVQERAGKINTGFFYDVESACWDMVDVSISVASNEVDERQSAFLTKVLEKDGEAERPRIYVAPRQCRGNWEQVDDGAVAAICKSSPSGKRLYDIKVTAKDSATGETVQDTCRVVVLPKSSQEGELRGAKGNRLTEQEWREVIGTSSFRTVVGTLSLQVVA